MSLISYMDRERGGHFVRVIGRGYSGIVEKRILDGKRVAVKRWNQISEEGRLQLENEVGVYQFLSDAQSEVLGEVIPSLHWSKCTADDLMLITEYVGYPITMNPDGMVTVGERSEKVLTASDISQVLEAARRSLQMLHDCGVSHGDIRLQNLRVTKLGELTSSDLEWKAWWVDLGRATICDYSVQKHIDMVECQEIFEDADVCDSE